MRPGPRLARGVTITRRQVSETEIFYLVRDPSTRTFLRMGEVEAIVLRLLDGERSLEEISETLDRGHDIAIEVHVIEGFVATLVKRGLVETGEFDPSAFREEWRQQERARRRTLGQLFGNVMTFKIKLLDPSRLFARIVGPLSFLWTRRFVIWSLAFMTGATALSIAHHEEIVASMRAFFSSATQSAGSFASHAAIVYGVFFLVIAVHESAHGLTCTRFGGTVRDMGFILFYLQIPGFYCDITDAYAFDSRGHRLWTTVAGGYSGLVLASLGTFLWWMTEAGGTLNGAGLALMFVGGPPLLMLNWNPFLRYDGYYIMMDLLEAPNLMANSRKYLGHLFKSRVLRVPVDPMPVPQRLRRIYVLYGIGSLLFIAPLIAAMPIIIYYVFSGLVGETIAMVLAALLGFRILKAYAGKAFATLRYAWLTHRAALLGTVAAQSGRTRAAAISAGAVVAALLLFVGPRFAVRAEAEAVLEPLERFEVRAMSPGFVARGSGEAMVLEGERVERGDLLVRLENPDLAAERIAVERELQGLRFDFARLRAGGNPAMASVRQAGMRALETRRDLLEERLAALEMRSPTSGTILTPRLEHKVGVYVKQGELWCVVGRTDRLRARVAVSQIALGAVEEGSPAEIKTLHMPDRTFPGVVHRLPPGQPPAPPSPLQIAGAVPRPTPSLAPGEDQTAEIAGTLKVEVEVDNATGLLRPGLTARVRIFGERLTIAGHLLRWARRLFLGKIWW